MKGNKIYSIFTGKCPVCHSGKMYKNNKVYSISQSLKMHERCSHCKTKFKIEPSFFYGAMYVSYGVTVAIGVAIFVTLNLIIGLSVKTTFIGIGVGLIALMPITARLARNIYINMFISYDKNWRDNS